MLRAAKAGHYNVVRALIAAGADIDLQDDTSLNPFLYGCINGDLELVRIAVEAGTNLELLTRFGGNGLTPAAEKGHVDVVEYLVTNTDINVNLTTVSYTHLDVYKRQAISRSATTARSAQTPSSCARQTPGPRSPAFPRRPGHDAAHPLPSVPIRPTSTSSRGSQRRAADAGREGRRKNR